MNICKYVERSVLKFPPVPSPEVLREDEGEMDDEREKRGGGEVAGAIDDEYEGEYKFEIEDGRNYERLTKEMSEILVFI